MSKVTLLRFVATNPQQIEQVELGLDEATVRARAGKPQDGRLLYAPLSSSAAVVREAIDVDRRLMAGAVSTSER